MLDDPRPIAQRDLGTWPALHRRPVSLQRDQIVADAGNLFNQVLAGRIVTAVNGVGGGRPNRAARGRVNYKWLGSRDIAQ